MSKSKKFELKEGRGSFWAVKKKDRRHKDIRFNGQANIKGTVRWVTLFKNRGGNGSPDLNLSIGDKVQKR